jgi:hypothetical protein
MQDPETQTKTLAETENFVIWSAEEPDGEMTYHLDFNNVTVHLLREEWEEFLDLVRELK